MRLPATLFAATCAFSVPALAQSWPQFRGPGGQGLAKAEALPASFTKQNEKWHMRIGRGHSSPVILGGKLVVTCEGAERGKRAIVCIDAATGKKLWRHEASFEPYRQHRFNSYASATPAVDEHGIYLFWRSGSALVALALDWTGKKLWERRVGAFAAQHGSGNSPILCGDMMIVANENEGEASFVAALAKQTGKERWRLDRKTAPRRASYSCPILYEPHAGKPYLVFASTAHGVYGVAPDSGEVLWDLDVGFTQRCVGTPCVSNDLVLVAAGSGGGGKECYVVRLPEPADKPETVRRLRRALPYVPSTIAIDGHYYMFSDGGVVTCLEAASAKLVWRERLDGTFFGSPVSNGKTIWIVDRAGTLFSLAAGEEFSMTGSYDLDELAYATPAIAGQRLYVRTAEHLICFGK